MRVEGWRASKASLLTGAYSTDRCLFCTKPPFTHPYRTLISGREQKIGMIIAADFPLSFLWVEQEDGRFSSILIPPSFFYIYVYSAFSGVVYMFDWKPGSAGSNQEASKFFWLTFTFHIISGEMYNEPIVVRSLP